MSAKTSRAFIENDLKQIRESYDLTDQHLFSMWVLSFFHWDGDYSSTVVGDIYMQSYALLEDGPTGDNCLDGFFFDEDACTLYLYQTKWPEKVEKIQTAADAREIGAALTILEQDSDKEESELPEARRPAVEALRKIIDAKGQIVLRNVSGGKWRDRHVETASECVPKSLAPLVDVEQFGYSDLQRKLGERKQDLEGKWIELDLYQGTGDPILHLPDTGVPGMGASMVILSSALSLAEQANSYGTQLFDRNVRHFLGKNKVNKDIEKSLKDETSRKAFWYGHNGITILCGGFKVIGDEHAPMGVKLENPQIVNGCQTATTLKEVFGTKEQRKKVDDFALLARVIQLVGDDEKRTEAAGDIAYWTNNQAAINDADLRANDREQRHFQKMLRSYGKSWFYERKRGEHKSLNAKTRALFKGKPERLITRDTYQQSWRAYTGSPAAAVAKKNEVWERGHGHGKDLYEKVFDTEHRRPCDVVLSTTLFEWYLKVFAVDRKDNSLAWELHKGLKKHAAEIRRAKSLVAAHSLALHGHIVCKAFGTVEAFPENKVEKILDGLPRGGYVKKNWNKGKIKKTLGDAPNMIMRVWSIYIQQIQKDETLYGVLKKDESLAQLVESLEGLLENDWEELLA